MKHIPFLFSIALLSTLFSCQKEVVLQDFDFTISVPETIIEGEPVDVTVQITGDAPLDKYYASVDMNGEVLFFYGKMNVSPDGTFSFRITDTDSLMVTDRPCYKASRFDFSKGEQNIFVALTNKEQNIKRKNTKYFQFTHIKRLITDVSGISDSYETLAARSLDIVPVIYPADAEEELTVTITNAVGGSVEVEKYSVWNNKVEHKKYRFYAKGNFGGSADVTCDVVFSGENFSKTVPMRFNRIKGGSFHCRTELKDTVGHWYDNNYGRDTLEGHYAHYGEELRLYIERSYSKSEKCVTVIDVEDRVEDLQFEIVDSFGDEITYRKDGDYLCFTCPKKGDFWASEAKIRVMSDCFDDAYFYVAFYEPLTDIGDFRDGECVGLVWPEPFIFHYDQDRYDFPLSKKSPVKIEHTIHKEYVTVDENDNFVVSIPRDYYEEHRGEWGRIIPVVDDVAYDTNRKCSSYKSGAIKEWIYKIWFTSEYDKIEKRICYYWKNDY